MTFAHPLALVLLLLIAASCGGAERDARGDAGVCRCRGDLPGGLLEVACGESACLLGGYGYRCTGPNEVQTAPEACARVDAGGPDAGCPPRSDSLLCADAERECGLLEIEHCGETRRIECGRCDAPETCGGANTAGECGCLSSQSDAELCEGARLECDAHLLRDDCGYLRLRNCGDTCEGFETCGGGGIEGRCGCTSESDEELCETAGADCGTITATDRCGFEREVPCGRCATPLGCGSGGVPHRCGCADDPDAAICERNEYECGSVRVRDSCDAYRNVLCGACETPETCGGGGTRGQCGCTGESSATLCERAGIECGPLVIEDACGETRELFCGRCTGTGLCSEGACVPFDEPVQPVCSAEGWCWANPLPQGNDLFDVDARNENAVWAVGAGGTALRWDGDRWSGWAGVGGGAALRSVLVRAPDDVWIAGEGGVVLRYDGRALDRVAVPAGGADLHAVWAVGDGPLWIGGEEMLLRFQGRRWTAEAVDFPIADLWGLEDTAPYAVGAMGVYRRVGGRWTRWFHGALRAISGIAEDHIWVAGDNVYRFDGERWSRTEADILDATSVWAHSEDAVYVGASYDSGVHFFNGSRWTWLPIGETTSGYFTPVREPGPALRGLSGGGDGMTAVGEGGVLYRRRDRRWFPVHSGMFVPQRDDGMRLPPQPMSAAMTASGVPRFGANSPLTPFAGVAEEHEGAWRHRELSRGVRALSGAGEMYWVVDGDGDVRSAMGSSFREVYIANAASIFEATPDDVWAVGGDHIARYDGAGWSTVTSPLSGTGAALTGVWGASPSAIWAVGAGGAVLRWDGRRWTTEASGTDASLAHVFGRSAEDVWAAGDVLAHRSGGRWVVEAAPEEGVASLHVDPAGVVYLVTEEGRLVRREASGRFVGEGVPLGRQVRAVTGDASALWVAGEEWSILRRE